MAATQGPLPNGRYLQSRSCRAVSFFFGLYRPMRTERIHSCGAFSSGVGIKLVQMELTSPSPSNLASQMIQKLPAQQLRAISGWLGLSTRGESLISYRVAIPPALTKITNTRPYIASCLVGCWLTDPLNHFFGRRGTLFWCGIFCTLSVIGQGLAQTWYQLLVCTF